MGEARAGGSMNKPARDFLWLNLKDLPYFRAILRAVEARFYQGLDLPRPILDVGCGDGHFASVAFETPLDVGVDLHLPSLREAGRRTLNMRHFDVQILGGIAMFHRSIVEMRGRVPLQTIRADVDYAMIHAHTIYGRIGVKVWLYKGDVFPERAAPATPPPPSAPVPPLKAKQCRLAKQR